MPIRPPASGRAHRRSDRERQVGAGAGAWPKRTGGVIVNADSAQVYRDLKVLSAGPTDDELRRAEHRLYGMRDGAAALLGGGLGGDGASARSTRSMRRPAADPGRRDRALSAHPARRDRAGPADRPGRSGARCATADVEANRARLDRARSRSGGAAQAGDTTRIARALEVVLSTGRTLGRMAAAARGRDRRRDRRCGR